MILIKLNSKNVHALTHTQRQPTLVYPVSPVLSRLHPSSRAGCECVV